MIKASDFGFFPGNTPEKNSAALQMAADIGGEILVDGKGIADVVFPMMVGNDTTVIFEDGLFLRAEKLYLESEPLYLLLALVKSEVNDLDSFFFIDRRREAR